MNITRRFFLYGAGAAAGSRFVSAGLSRFKIGVTDWTLQMSGKVEALAVAKKLGFEGVEIALGRQPVDGRLLFADTEIQKRYLAAAKELGIALAGTCLDILHVNFLKSDKLAPKWVMEGIGITKALDARVMLVPCFERGSLTSREDKDRVGDLLRELAPAAAKAGIVLGLEDTISAEDNVYIMERSRSDAVKVYYDVGNSTRKGFDVVKEIRWLGSSRIGQIHLKDQGYLGEGVIDFPAVLKAISDIGFEAFANFETSSPSNSIEKDLSKNLAFIRKLMT